VSEALKRIVTIFLLCVVVLYAGLVLVALAADRFIFPAPWAGYDDAALAAALAREAPPGRLVRFRSGEEELAGFHLPNPEARYTLLFSHGNGEDLAGVLPLARAYRQAGYAVFAYDYRGYGTSTGRPSEAGLYADALAAWDCLTARLGVPSGRVVAMGRSLGTAAAIELARLRPVAGVVLEAPLLTAFRTVVPFRVLPWDKLRSMDKVAEIRAPLLVIHGRTDEVIPYWHGERIFALAAGPKRFVAVDEGRHMDALHIARDRYLGALRDFVELLDAAAAGPGVPRDARAAQADR
jgi:fermentation-respiration switch protein FrsA (DUF1100 family)